MSVYQSVNDLSMNKRYSLPCSGLLDKRRLHPVADASLQLMMMVTNNRLFFQILHRRTAHVERLLESKHLQSRGADNVPRGTSVNRAKSPSGPFDGEQAHPRDWRLSHAGAGRWMVVGWRQRFKAGLLPLSHSNILANYTVFTIEQFDVTQLPIK